MKINNLGYLFKEGVRGIFLHGFMSFAAVCITVASLLIVGTFAAITYNLSIIVEQLNHNSEVLVYVDETYTLDLAKNVESKVRLVANVDQANLMTKEEVLEDFVNAFDDPTYMETVTPDTFEYRVRVRLLDNRLLAQTVESLQLIPGVTEVDSPDGLIEGFVSLQEVLPIVSVVIIVVLRFVSLLIISNTVKLAQNDRKEEISIMKMVGATNGFIRLPFMVQGFTLGMVGAGVAFGLEWLLYNAMAAKLNEFGSLDFLQFVPFEQLLLPMVITFFGAGLFVGVVGSWTSIRKFLNV